MKKIFVIFLLLASCSSLSFGQLLPAKHLSNSKMAIKKVKQPLLLIGSSETNYNSLVIESGNLKIIKVYQDLLELIPFGEKGKDGIILAALTTETPLHRLEEVLDYFKIPATDRTLKVLVNKRMVNPDLFLADVKRIVKIEKTKQEITSVMRYSFNIDEEFLNIVTIKD